MTLLRGTYRVLGASPDGDSVRFTPDDPQGWAKAGIAARVNATGGAQLRLDAIDALEMHYTPRSSPITWHQRPELAAAPADRLLAMLGFTEVVRNPAGTVTAATPQERPGSVLSRFADKYGRPVAIAYPAEEGPGSDVPDGSPVWLDAARLQASVNYQLLAEGLVYPTFYSKLYVDLRTALTEVTVAARQSRSGVWAADQTTAGFEVTSWEQVMNELVIVPKLFRRLVDYLSLQAPDLVDLGGFSAFLAARDDRVFTVPDGRSTGFDSLVTVTGQHVALTVEPERIVFIEA